MIFIWIPKTGGTTFFEETPDLQLYTEDYHRFDNTGSVTFGHACIKEILRAGIITQAYWDSQKKYAIVRNPYDRFVSLYFDFLRTSRIAPGTTPEQFASALKHTTRRPGLYNAKDYSQCAAQVEWIVPGTNLLYFETLIQFMPKKNAGNYEWHGYSENLLNMVTELYYEDFVMLNYPVCLRLQDSGEKAD